jgi:hypothetical protein
MVKTQPSTQLGVLSVHFVGIGIAFTFRVSNA